MAVLQLNGSQANSGGTFYFPFRNIHPRNAASVTGCCLLPCFKTKNPFCAKQFCMTCLRVVIGPLFSSFFRADLTLVFLCADPPTTSAVDLKGLLFLLVRDNSVSLVCLLGTVKIMSGDSAVWTTVC